MPQMSPLWWLMLFIMFSVTLITFSLINFFITIIMPHLMEDKLSFSISSMNWKW
uniref:ATP synthase F0 subunit 8 n=1 Tax=Phaneroptera nigroantennata TaxID=420848 RepID=A0A1W6LR96_9ORTH|nr:ATP synthase F0 subunit 8 [Phaneroptera nigroantennata]ARN59036.1 ATP synthase F0 subunit 8 [Phaneroptera nigroantennata]